MYGLFSLLTPLQELFQALGGSRSRLLQLTRASFELTDWDLIGLGGTERWKKIHPTPSDLLEG